VPGRAPRAVLAQSSSFGIQAARRDADAQREPAAGYAKRDGLVERIRIAIIVVMRASREHDWVRVVEKFITQTSF